MLRERAKVLLCGHMFFYDKTLSTELQRHHIINDVNVSEIP